MSYQLNKGLTSYGETPRRRIELLEERVRKLLAPSTAPLTFRCQACFETHAADPASWRWNEAKAGAVHQDSQDHPGGKPFGHQIPDERRYSVSPPHHDKQSKLPFLLNSGKRCGCL